MKCKVCGKRFKLQADKRYEVAVRKEGLADVLLGKMTIFECFDCPKCGCQNAMNVREKTIIEIDGKGKVTIE